MKRVAQPSAGVTTALIYTRVSSDEQAREGVSLDAQLAESRRYAASHGWVLSTEYQDVLAGTRDDRPQYQALLSQVRRLREDRASVVVVVARLDRLGRRLLERVRCREELKLLGVPVHSVREGGEVSDLVANILGSVAEEEVRLLGERVSIARQHIAANGWRPVGTCPWGYRWRPATDDERRQGAPKSVLEVDPDTAPYVSNLFKMVADGATVRSAMRWIATLPDGARGGRVLGHTSVQKTLRMPVYVGRRERTDGQDVMAGPPQRWPALVDDATWAKVHERINGQARMPRQASGDYLLTGLIRCPECGGRMSGWRIKSRSPRYRCERRAPPCYGDCMATPVETVVLAEIGALVSIVASTDPALRGALRREWERLQQPSSDGARIQRTAQPLEREVATARKRLTDAAVLLVDGTIDKAGYERLRDKATADLEAAEAELARLTRVTSVPALPSFDDVLREAGGWARAIRDANATELRELIGILVESVLPTRRRVGRYEAQITWTAVGKALRGIVKRRASAA